MADEKRPPEAILAEYRAVCERIGHLTYQAEVSIPKELEALKAQAAALNEEHFMATRKNTEDKIDG